MPITLLDAIGDRVVIQEGESSDLTITFVDGNGNAIQKSNFVSVLLTLYDRNRSTIINGRLNQNVLDANDGTMSVNGVLTLKLGPSDNIIVGTAPNNTFEEHVARFVWTWNDGTNVRTGIEETLFLVENLTSLN